MKKKDDPGSRPAANPGTRPGLARFLTVFTLMSRIPVNRHFEADFTRADFWIPALSPLVSLASLTGFWAGMALTGSFFLASLSSIALQYFLFNLFHFDGLVDSADALLPVASRERRLEILKDPRVGTYGFFCGLLVLSAKIGGMLLLAEEGIEFIFLTASLLAAPAAGRAASALIALKLAPARPEGLGSFMKGFSASRIAMGSLVALVPALAFSWLAGSWLLAIFIAASAVLATILSAFIVGRAYTKALGGFTGDSLGAAIEIGELLMLVISGIVLKFLGSVVI
ncbi:MAG: adenosylcobinamide-GDP ribazoletransferase [Rectinemataceae bacterium]|nr:adenosylcobinamide-GDP ribazoletransferase [Rectinemataceae bacterium]